MTTSERKKRYICSFVTKIDKKFVPNVVVIAASNNIIARALLCKRYGVKNIDIPTSKRHSYDMEGINSIRLSETNVYEGGSVNDNFVDNDSET